MTSLFCVILNSSCCCVNLKCPVNLPPPLKCLSVHSKQLSVFITLCPMETISQRKGNETKTINKYLVPVTRILKISHQSLPFVTSKYSSLVNTHTHTLFSHHLGKHEDGNMSLRLNFSKQLAHKLFPELICLYLETRGIYVQHPRCIWEESILNHLPLEIKKVDKYISF